MNQHVFRADKVIGWTISKDEKSLTLSIGVTNEDSVDIGMDFSLAAQFADSLRAAQEELIRLQSADLTAKGFRSGAYRKCEEMNASIDATGSALLLEFDPGKPHRVGVAVPLDVAPKWFSNFQRMISEATSQGGRKQ